MVSAPNSYPDRGQLREGHRLVFSGFSAIDGDTLATELISELVGLIDGGDSGGFRQIYGFADGCIAVLLESGLHLDVPLWGNIEGRFEDSPYRS